MNYLENKKEFIKMVMDLSKEGKDYIIETNSCVEIWIFKTYKNKLMDLVCLSLEKDIESSCESSYDITKVRYKKEYTSEDFDIVDDKIVVSQRSIYHFGPSFQEYICKIDDSKRKSEEIINYCNDQIRDGSFANYNTDLKPYIEKYILG